MIVVDTNIVAYLYLPGEYTRKVEHLLTEDPDWSVPILWRSEFRSILAGYLRRQSFSFEFACELLAEAEHLLMGGEHEVDSRLVMRLVRDSNCSAYDCEFVALAMSLGVKLVTMDAKLRRGFPDVTMSLPNAPA